MTETATKTEPRDGFLVQGRDSAGLIHTHDVSNFVAKRDRTSRGIGFVVLHGHQFRLMAQAHDFLQIEGLVAVAEFRGEDGKPARQHPAILDYWGEAKDFEGSVAYQYGSLLIVGFLLERPTTDAVLAAEAQRGAENLVERWLAAHDFAPREYRPKRFSEGYVVTPTPFDAWRPRPLSMIDGERNFPGLRSRDYLYDARALIGAAEAKGD